MLPVAEKEVLAILGSSNMHWMVLKKVKEVCIWVAMAVMLIVPVQVMSGRHKGQAQEIRVQKYNRYFLESICQKALGNSSAQYDLLERALSYCPEAPEALVEMASLKARNPLVSMQEVDSLYRKAVRLRPANGQYLWETARFELEAGMTDSAIVLLEKLKTDPALKSNAYATLMDIYLQQEKDSMLVNHIDEWLKEGDAEEETIRREKYKALMRLCRYDDALKEVDILCGISPKDEYYPVLRPMILLEKGDMFQAWQVDSLILLNSPENVYAQLFRLQYYEMTGRGQEMETLLERFLLDSCRSPQDRLPYAKLYISRCTGVHQEQRIDSLFHLLFCQPMSTAHLVDVYVAYLDQKKAPDSSYTIAMGKKVEIDPSDKISRLRWVWGLYNQQNFPLLLDACEQGIVAVPEEMCYYLLGGIAASSIKEYARALRIFQEGQTHVVSQSDDGQSIVSDFFSSYGDLLYNMGEKEKGYAMYDSSLVRNPSNVSTLNNYAYFLALDSIRLDDAERMAALAVKYAPDESNFLDTYAWVLFRRGQYKKSLAPIEKALQRMKNPSHQATLYEHAGDIYIMLGMEEKALQAWGEALQREGASSLLPQKIKLKKYLEP